MEKDFKDLLSEFNAHKIRYLIVGGYAYSRYTEPRTTKDLDLFVACDPETASAVYVALAEFGAPLEGVSIFDLAKPTTVIQIGVPPFRVDVIFNIDGVSFSQAWGNSEPAFVDDEVPVRFISEADLIENKLASGREQDLLDVKKLQQAIKARKRV